MDRLLARARSLRPEELARSCRLEADQLTPPKDLDQLDAARAGARGLWFSRPNRTGMVNLTGVLDPEGAAVIRSAIDPLSAPCPLTDQHGHLIEPDPRPAHQRRADALVEIVARGVSAPGAAPTTDKAKVIVTIDLEALADHLPDHGPQREPSAAGRVRWPQPVPAARPRRVWIGQWRGQRLRRRVVPGDGPALGLRRRDHPGRARLGEPATRRGPVPSPGDPRDAHGPVAARPRLHLPRLLRARSVDRRTPRDPLGRRRRDRPDQPGAALPTTPLPRPPAPPHRHHHPDWSHVAHLAAVARGLRPPVGSGRRIGAGRDVAPHHSESDNLELSGLRSSAHTRRRSHRRLRSDTDPPASSGRPSSARPRHHHRAPTFRALRRASRRRGNSGRRDVGGRAGPIVERRLESPLVHGGRPSPEARRTPRMPSNPSRGGPAFVARRAPTGLSVSVPLRAAVRYRAG